MIEIFDVEVEFDYLLIWFDVEKFDVILVEGCKNIVFLKIELYCVEVGKFWFYFYDKNIIVIVVDEMVVMDLL